MSRTIRRKTGYRWFAKKQRVYVQTGVMYYWEGVVRSLADWDNPRPVCWLAWESIQARPEYDVELISRYTRDKKFYGNRYSPFVKEYDNYTRRACQRQQLQKIMKWQEHYDASFEDSKCRGALWYFD